MIQIARNMNPNSTPVWGKFDRITHQIEIDAFNFFGITGQHSIFYVTSTLETDGVFVKRKLKTTVPIKNRIIKA